MITPTHISRLATKQLVGTITSEEARELQEWADSAPAYRKWLDGLTEANLMDTIETYSAYQPVEDVWDNPRIGPHIHPEQKGQRLRSWIRYAAAVLIVACAGIWYFADRRTDPADNQPTTSEIQPGGHRATLTLGDGVRIGLSEAQTGIIVGDELTYRDGSHVIGTGQLSFDNPSLLYSTLEVPKGGTYQVTLPDGSEVWLNAASTLRYPSQFSDGDRRVELTGEAYFSVREDYDRPFKVISQGQEIEVLGTEFNISAYAEDAETKTTLIEGKVRLATTGDRRQTVILHPGEQSVLHGTNVKLNQVDTALYTAWKKGYFAFDNASIQEVMKQLARWYDINVIYKGTPAAGVTFDGKIGRNLTLQQLLTGLSATHIRYQINDNTLTIINQP